MAASVYLCRAPDGSAIGMLANYSGCRLLVSGHRSSSLGNGQATVLSDDGDVGTSAWNARFVPMNWMIGIAGGLQFPGTGATGTQGTISSLAAGSIGIPMIDGDGNIPTTGAVPSQ